MDVLKFELKFIEDGGYRRSPKSPSRPLYIFEDSPTCLNHDAKDNREPCGNCVLMYLVPLEMQSARVPCRHIPLNLSGDTLDFLYCQGPQHEIEEKVGEWLRAAIEQLEAERMASQQHAGGERRSEQEMVKGTPLYRSLHPKCANPACSTAFHWTGGGKFFRFRPESHDGAQGNSTFDSPRGIHGVRHYWLCERCFHMFTLVYDGRWGVVLKALWPELAAMESDKGVSAA